MDDFVSKPIGRDELLDVVARAGDAAAAPGDEPGRGSDADGGVGDGDLAGAAGADGAEGGESGAGGPDAGAPVLDDAALDSLRSLDPDGRLPDRLVDLFLSESASRVDQLREAAREGDTDRVRRLAHGFKGSAGYFGASRLLTVCRDLEIHAPDASPAELAAAAEEVAGCLSEAEAAINAVRERERTA